MDNDIKTFILQENEKLAQMVQAGFAAIDKRFTAIDEKFVAIDEKFAAVDKRFDHIDQRLDNIERGIGYRVSSLERDVAELKA